MCFLTRLLITLILVTGLWFLANRSVHAEGEFNTDYKVNYQIDKNGKTVVTQQITLENKTPNFYADKFELKIGSTKVTEVKARDEAGDLETEVNFDNNITTIRVKFNQRVIGAGKKLNWTLNYSSSEITTKSGQIWEISIPKLAKTSDINSYELTVNVPKSLGPQAFTIPEPSSAQEVRDSTSFMFTKDQLTSSGIAMSFGEKQVYSFSLKYYLENTNVTTQVMDIALPPDNNYQKIVLSKIEPKPQDVIVDDDGNFLAKYKLKPKEKIEILVGGDVEVFSKPFRKIQESLSKDQKEKYLQPQKYWEVDNIAMKEKANELKTIQEIYNFVTSTLTYSNNRLNQPKIERKGAAAALTSPDDSVCMEFTDLFITLARAAGIPAREVQGYAYTQNERLRPLSLSLYNGDILHAWPEYWDQERGWVQVDPTWGSTSGGLDYLSKLDFNHVTFIQRGISSTEPYPAGAYKLTTQNQEKTVYVQFAQELPRVTSNAQLDLDVPSRTISSLPLKINAILTNTGTTSIIGQKLKIDAQNIDISGVSEFDIPILPPFSKKTYSFQLQTKGLFKSSIASLILTYGELQTSKQVNVEPFYKIALEPMFLVTLSLTILIIALGLFLFKKIHIPPKPKIAT